MKDEHLMNIYSLKNEIVHRPTSVLKLLPCLNHYENPI